jgi:hypothetical protein
MAHHELPRASAERVRAEIDKADAWLTNHTKWLPTELQDGKKTQEEVEAILCQESKDWGWSVFVTILHEWATIGIPPEDFEAIAKDQVENLSTYAENRVGAFVEGFHLTSGKVLEAVRQFLPGLAVSYREKNRFRFESLSARPSARPQPSAESTRPQPDSANASTVSEPKPAPHPKFAETDHPATKEPPGSACGGGTGPTARPSASTGSAANSDRVAAPSIQENEKGSMDRPSLADPIWTIPITQKGPIPVTRLTGEVEWINTSEATEPDDADLTLAEEMRITETTLGARSELRSEIETAFSGPAWPAASAIVESFRRYAIKIFDVNAMVFCTAASKQGKNSDEVLHAMLHNLLTNVFGIEWESSPGEKVNRTDWQDGREGWKGREVVVIAGNDPDKNCLYHELISDAVRYRYRFHDVLPSAIPGEPRGINLSNVEWWKYIGLNERHNLAMAIKPYLEDRMTHWQVVYTASAQTEQGSGIESDQAPPHAATAADAGTIEVEKTSGRKESVLPRSEYRAWLGKLKSLALLGSRYRRRSIVPSVSALQRLHVNAMDLLLGIGPSVSKIREELEGLRLANYGSQRDDWRVAHVYPGTIKRFTRLLIAAHRLLEREQRAMRVTATGHAQTFQRAGEDRISAAENPAAFGVSSDITDRPGKPRKGDATLLHGKRLVTFATAEEYLGISERQRQKLMNSGALKVEGQGQNRRITSESLKAYLPPEIPN